MARKNRINDVARSNIRDIASTISNNMNTLYKSTYMTTPQQSKDLEDLNDRINASIDSIINRNIDTAGIGTPSISKLYARMIPKGGDSNQVVNELEKMFDNGIVTDDLYGMFMSNRYLRELDDEIDTVCKYMPKLEEALAAQKDAVLSADHFSKDFLNLENPGNGVEIDVFSERAKELKQKYSLARLVEEIYEDTSKYGEKFIYRVPYSIAIGRLLSRKSDTQIIAPSGLNESSSIDEENEKFMFTLDKNGCSIISETANKIFSESFSSNTVTGSSKENNTSGLKFKDDESFKIGIEICKSGILESAVESAQAAFNTRQKYSHQSLKNIHTLNEARNKSKKDIEATGNLTFGPPSKLDSKFVTVDGLIPSSKQVEKITKVEAPGCVIRKLDRDKVLPIYIDDICMGYYVFELRKIRESETFMGFKNILGDPLSNMRGEGGNKSAFNTVDNERQDDTIRFVAGRLSSFIDKQFVNRNQDLAKEIYMILKYNDLFNTPSIDMIKITFVPPEDMVHFFFKQDQVTHRGVSDLDKALVPAKIYSSLYITSAIGKMTRGQDRRVYYVKQTVDTNIAQTLLNTISQIKQSNFNIRQFQNINNVLNIIGKFNDFVIPTNASGDPPIQFEIMPGQQVDTPTELMETLEEMAINSTGIPIEIIQARRSIDYAMQLTMSSSKVLRFCYKRQELFQEKLTELISPIYNYEYDDNVIIEVTLPPPSFINITNTNQLIDNTKGFVDSIVEIELANEQDEDLKQRYRQGLFSHYIGTHLDVASHKAILNKCRIESARDKDESHANETESDF